MFEPVQNDISYIAENGSLCIHNHEIISRGVIDRDLGLRIIEASRQYDSCNCLVSCEDHCYTDSKDEHFISHILNTIKYDMVVVDDLKQIQMCIRDRLLLQVSLLSSALLYQLQHP